MKKKMSILAVVAGLTLVLAGGSSGAVPADDLVERCVTENVMAHVAPVSNRPTVQEIQMRKLCDGASVIVQRIDGTLRQQVNLPRQVDIVDYFGSWGSFTVPVANGVGTWLITHVQDPSGSYQLTRPVSFVVPRASIIPVRNVAWSAPGRTYTVKSRVLKYISTGALVPMAGLTVKVSGSRYREGTYYPLATLRTDANGWFTYSRVLTQEFQFDFAAARVSPVIEPARNGQVVLFRPGVAVTSFHRNVAIGVPTTIKGYAGPGTKVVGLSEYDFTTQRYIDTGARATTGAGGNFVLRYTPWSGSDVLALVTPPNGAITGEGSRTPGLLVDAFDPIVRLTGKATVKYASVARPSSTMSTYGRLSLADPNGVTTPVTNGRVVVQIRPKVTPTAPYKTVASATTTATGYFYTNWTATVDAHVRVAYLSDTAHVKSAFTYLRFLDVQ